jgi:hypothetical protein
MWILKDVEVRIEGKTFRISALFNSSSSFTIMEYGRLKELFGDVELRSLTKPRERKS